jgi:hypothetical protein
MTSSLAVLLDRFTIVLLQVSPCHEATIGNWLLNPAWIQDTPKLRETPKEKTLERVQVLIDVRGLKNDLFTRSWQAPHIQLIYNRTDILSVSCRFRPRERGLDHIRGENATKLAASNVSGHAPNV